MNDGAAIPVMGFGTYCDPPRDRVAGAVRAAIESGYRLVDTAMVYQNERFVGQGIMASGVPREDLFITTKVYKDAMRFGAVRESLEESLDALGLDHVDLVLIHRPLREHNAATWHDLEDARNDGLATSIGVSNFLVRHLDALAETSTVVPAVNQVEMHPFFFRRELLEACQARGIVIEAYSPLVLGRRLHDSTLATIAGKHGKTPAQVLLRWSIQHGCVPIPRSLDPAHIRENASVFDFALDEADMQLMDSWNEDYMAIQPDPDEPDVR